MPGVSLPIPYPSRLRGPDIGPPARLPVVDLHPAFDVLVEPHLALCEVGHGTWEVRPACDLVRPLSGDSAEADADFVGSDQPDRTRGDVIRL
jgi:hypothetical protein